MIWPEGVKVPRMFVPEGYVIRILRNTASDTKGIIRVMREAGLGEWSEEGLAKWHREISLPDGVFVAVHKKSGKITASAMATHQPTALHPSGGEIGWVAASPGHSGKGLGKAVSVAALRRLTEAGYKRVFLKTDDFRLAAIKTYLNIGVIPFL